MSPTPRAVIYLICWSEQPYRSGRHHGASHYLGVALDGDVGRRVRQHLHGLGSPLVAAAVSAGARPVVTRTWAGGRQLERRLKGLHGARLCPRPLCRERQRQRRWLLRHQPPLPLFARPTSPLAEAA